MKKLLYTLLAVSFIFAACKKEDDAPVAINGCTESTATNYNSNATNDDGSCTYDLVGTWTTTKITEDVYLSVSMGGIIVQEEDYLDVMTDSLDPSSMSFLSNGTLYMYGDEEMDTVSWAKSGDILSITDEDTTTNVTIQTLNATDLILELRIDTSFTDQGVDVVYDITQTLELTRNTLIAENVNQRLGNTSNNSWFDKTETLNRIRKKLNNR